MLKVLIKNAMVIDGSGKRPYYADLGIKEDKIILPVRGDISAKKVINANNLCLAPGFIDIHSHSELSLLVNPTAESKLYQGVTTEVVGNCGFSAAPVEGSAAIKLSEKLAKYKQDLNWRSFAEYKKELSNKDIAPNVLSFVGQGVLRHSIVGMENRNPSRIELKRMKAILAQALEAGAIGLSSGLAYPPSSYASKEELIELTKVVSFYNKVYAIHLRDEGPRLLDAVKEALDIAYQSKVSLQISHHKVLGLDKQYLIKESLELIKGARENGLDVNCDIYPYLASQTTLSSILPQNIFVGAQQATRKKLARQKEEVIANLLRNHGANFGTKIVFLAGERKGKTLEQLAKDKNLNWAETLIEIILTAKSSISILKFNITKETITEVLTSEFSMVASDSMARRKDHKQLANNLCHPRTYGAFSKVINHYVREGTLSLETAIAKMTSLPAKKLGLKRGFIKNNYPADLILFDLDQFRNHATYKKPHQYTTGIKYLFVNGKLLIDDETLIRGKKSGLYLKN